MQNFELLKELGRINKPILLKRGLSATIKEWLMSAEYIMAGGNENIILCERGIRSFDSQYTRNVLDLAAVPVLKELTHLPVIVDPSHATGKSKLVPTMSAAATAAGADGIMVEVHNNPSCALCVGAQSLTPAQFHELNRRIQKIREAIHQEIQVVVLTWEFDLDFVLYLLVILFLKPMLLFLILQ
jgi:3-deoxy-7-phosphoheptulonate synthase